MRFVLTVLTAGLLLANVSYAEWAGGEVWGEGFEVDPTVPDAAKNISDADTNTWTQAAAMTNDITQLQADMVANSNRIDSGSNYIDAVNTIATGNVADISAIQSDYLQKAGGTLTGAVLTTASSALNAPTDDEVPSAGWVRSLAVQGQEWFFTSTPTNLAWLKTTNSVQLSTTIPAAGFTNTTPTVTNNMYLAAGITTQTFGEVRSPMEFDIYMARVGGNVSSVLPVKPEIYYVYDGDTNQLGDYSVDYQNVVGTTITRYTFTLSFVQPVLTGKVSIIGYLKSGTVSGSPAQIAIAGGNGQPSHMDINGIPGETAAEVAADLAVVTSNYQRASVALTTTNVYDSGSSNDVDLLWTQETQAYLVNYHATNPANITYDAAPSPNSVRDLWAWVNFASGAVAVTFESGSYFIDENNTVTNVAPSAIGTEAAFLFRQVSSNVFIWSSPTGSLVNPF